MTYKDHLTETMTKLSRNQKIIFLGYNVRHGHQFNGTLVNVPKNQLLEMPVAENLILGVAMGLAFEGYRPIVCIERMDFLWACADALVNHLDKARDLGWPTLNVVIRTCVGNGYPLDPGVQHKGNYYSIMKQLLKEVKVTESWDELFHDGPVMVVEYKDRYEQDYTA